MLRTLLLTSALLVSAPALAQETAQSQTQPPQGSSPAAPQQAAPAQPSTAQPAAPQTAAPATTASAIASIVDSEFAAYDVNKDGQLDQAEFSRWMVALKDQEMKSTGTTLPADKLTAWVNGAFTTADRDKSITVSKPELITYLSNGAA
ncbi:calcium-binding protein [Sphingobium amiense]|uniref:Calcium-binding protein n=1 Tax=Sphingobium amiense TaxID=135719 RepID=A0A494VWX0_9SPHN|nr:calcium-binding protein [Sphingobium amiense]BBD96903.1 calcium-binding protein [Sphingobium amiense]